MPTPSPSPQSSPVKGRGGYETLKTPSKAMTSGPREKTTPHLSVVIPAFNEEARIGPTLDALVGYLDTQTYSREVVVVDDGSTDDTVGVVERRAARPETPVRVESIPHAGKGWAVRHGMLSSSGRYRFMCDADLAMPVRHLGRLPGPHGRGLRHRHRVPSDRGRAALRGGHRAPLQGACLQLGRQTRGRRAASSASGERSPRSSSAAR